MISDMQNASREEKIDYLLSREKGSYTFDDLVLIMELLRSFLTNAWNHANVPVIMPRMNGHERRIFFSVSMDT